MHKEIAAELWTKENSVYSFIITTAAPKLDLILHRLCFNIIVDPNDFGTIYLIEGAFDVQPIISSHLCDIPWIQTY